MLRLMRSMFGLASAAMLVLCSAAGLAACGSDDDTKPVSAASSSALLAQIPTLGAAYPAQLERFVDTDEGKAYGLAVTIAPDNSVVAYLCDGRTLGRAFAGSIEAGADRATLQAVTGEGTVELQLSGDTPSVATVTTDDMTGEFTLASTDVGGYYREEVKGVTRGWVVSDSLAIKGVQSSQNKALSGTQGPPLSPEDQALVGVKEDPDAQPQTRAFFKNRRCQSLQNQYNAAVDAYLDSSGTVADANAANLALAKGRSLGCTGWTTGSGANFITV